MIVASVAGLLSFNANAQTAVNYSSTVNSQISFDGSGHFTFAPAANNLVITSGTASGLSGQLTGTYGIGTISTAGNVSTAPVSGTGTLTIFDGSKTFTATLACVDIQQVGTGGSLNVTGAVNLTGVSYAGTNPDLKALATAGSGSNALSFHFTGAPLSALASGAGSYQTSFSGSFSTP